HAGGVLVRSSLVIVTRRTVLCRLAMAGFLSAHEVAQNDHSVLDSLGSGSAANSALVLQRSARYDRRSFPVMSGGCVRYRWMRRDISQRNSASIKETNLDHDGRNYRDWARELFHRRLRRWIVLANTGFAGLCDC